MSTKSEIIALVLHVEALPAIPCPERFPAPQSWIDCSPLQRYTLLRAYGFAGEKQALAGVTPVLPVRDLAYLAWPPGPDRTALLARIDDAGHKWERMKNTFK